MSVPVAASGDAPALSKPRLITQLRPGETVTDVAPDGRSFAVIRAAGTDAATPPEARELVFMLNVFDEIRRRLAAAGAP